MAEQTVHLELYAPNVKSAFARAQSLADARKHAVVTAHHLIKVMLEAGWGHKACVRVSLIPEEIAARASAVLDAMPSNATSLAYLDATLLAVMSAAEGLMKELGRQHVDFQCVFRALGDRDLVPRRIGYTGWPEEELAGGPPPPAPATKMAAAHAQPFEVALFAAAATLDGLAAEIAKATGADAVPTAVARTLQKIAAKLGDVPELAVEWESPRRLTIARNGRPGRLTLGYAPPEGVVLSRGDAASTFALARDTNAWVGERGELFATVRAEVLALYPETSETSGKPS